MASPILEAQKEAKIIRIRLRKDSFKFDREKVSARLHTFYTDDLQDSSYDKESRIQRYAKYRQWAEIKDQPWPDSSNIALPDITTNSLRTQDTLHNAVMSSRPAVNSKASNQDDMEKQELIDDLIDYQFFEEQEGENIIGEMAEAFVNDGLYTAFVPWVKEYRKTHDIKIFNAISEDTIPELYFEGLVRDLGPAIKLGDGWDWDILPEEEDEYRVSFYTRKDNKVEMVIKRDVVIYDGPKVIIKDYEDVLAPVRAANLQIPGPSNPGGAQHVILYDRPTLDEILRLENKGFYDLMTEEDVEKLKTASIDDSNDNTKKAKDDMQGVTNQTVPREDLHKQLTRLVVFDIFDIDGDGIGEDVIWWMILETKTIVKAKVLTEMYPSNPPKRPLFEAQFLPVKGRRVSIGLIELQEGMHDAIKYLLDQAIDNGDLMNSPWGFYRPTSNMNPEVIRMAKGELYPIGDPSRDVNFPSFGNSSQVFAFNMITMLQTMTERLTTTGDLQLGRVPQGKASALRTVSGMQTILAQGEARPERILRRFFMGLTDIWQHIHQLNQTFLPKEKQFRISRYVKQGEDPYRDIKNRNEISGNFQFTFTANVLNTNKSILQEVLFNMIGTYISEFNFQTGIINSEGAYRLQRDWGKSLGQNPDTYLTKPTPDADKQKILAEEAISSILDGQMPSGIPMEPTQEHFEKLMAFMEDDGKDNDGTPPFGYLDENSVEIFKLYLQQVKERLQLEMQQAQIAQAAEAVGGQSQTTVAGGQPSEGEAPLNENELSAEDLPSSGGGASGQQSGGGQ